MFPGRLARYIFFEVAMGVAIATTIILTMIVLVDFVELSRTLGTRAAVSPVRLFFLALMHAPSLIEDTLPFVFLFGVMWSMFRLNRRSELVVMRAAGMSAWRFLAPAMLFALVIGIAATTVLNPLGARLSSEFERRREAILNPGMSTVGVAEGGVWLREAREDGQLVVRAKRAEAGGRRLIDVTMYFYDLAAEGPPRFRRRIDAAEAQLRPGFWQVSEAWEFAPDEEAVRHNAIAIPTTLAAEGLIETIGTPESQSFWELRQQARLLREAGFASTAYELRWHRLLAMTVTLIAMTVIATSASLRLSRSGGAIWLAVAGAGVGFGLFFLESFLAAFGDTGSMPIPLSAW
ncbi:MAG: LptF/LptG family permease, partial [Maricaulaceae bacterium]